MSKAYVLMTALPPTKGHLHLIEFASHLAASLGGSAEVIVCTQPSEPFVFERLSALRKATEHIGNVNIHHIHKELPQEPEGHEGFWDMWRDFLLMFGLMPDDYIVASERYGLRLAQECGVRFMPYDIDRSIYQGKATRVRENARLHFDMILNEFQQYLRKRITIFGAESTGKTTLSRDLAKATNGWWLPEWARPYLETVGPEINPQSMTEIYLGQAAMQRQAYNLWDKPFIIQDTDLYSTWGYWVLSPMHTATWGSLGGIAVPEDLKSASIAEKSDLYLITRANIPFEQDPIRYGGDQREISDEAWINFAIEHELNFAVLESTTRIGRLAEAQIIIESFFDESARLSINYRRQGKEYEHMRVEAEVRERIRKFPFGYHAHPRYDGVRSTQHRYIFDDQVGEDGFPDWEYCSHPVTDDLTEEERNQ